MGNFLSVSKAKESFLERLQREREQDNHIGSKLIEMSMKSNADLDREYEEPKHQLPVIQKEVSSGEDSSSDEEEVKIQQIIKISKPVAFSKIPSVNAMLNKANFNREEPVKSEQAILDDMKRQQSLQKLKDLHKEQKNAIRNALLDLDSTAPRSNKIIFEPPEPVEKKSVAKPNNHQNKSALFGDDEGDEDEEVNSESFKLKKQFEGKKGEKLFELQTRFQNDKRFKIDEKFADQTDEFIDSRKNYTREELKERKRLRKEIQNWDQDELKEERDNQLNILEGITGESTSFNDQKTLKPPQKGMLRFDPTKKSHLKYLDIVKGDEPMDEDEDVKMEVKEDSSAKEVGEERFYEVSENLTDAFNSNQNSKPFSIFGMLGIDNEENRSDKDDSEKEEMKEVKANKIPTKVHALQMMSQARFKYDSSDTDEEVEAAKTARKKKQPEKKSKDGKYSKSGVWRFNFFFSEDDKRLKDACAFIKKSVFVEPETLAVKRNQMKKVLKNKVRKAKLDKEKHELKKRRK